MNFALFKEMSNLKETLFAFPFIFAGAFLPFKQLSFIQFFQSRPFLPIWIFSAFILARVSGMAFNQWQDWKIDAKNPRTQHRVIPSHRVKAGEVAAIAWVCLAMFLAACFFINPLCFIAALLPALFIASYPLFKRVHALCHFVLGIIYFSAPVMAWIAITGTISAAPFLLGLASLCMIVGNDIIYALQDLDFDRKEGVHSLPVAIGSKNALMVARFLHFLCLTSLFTLGLFAKLQWVYDIGLLFIGMLLIYYHYAIQKYVVGRGELRKIYTLFFFCNLFFGLSLMIFLTLGTLWAVS